MFMEIRSRLRELRRAAGLTQAELADRTGVSQPAISQLENGIMSMDLQWMRAFARVLGCAPADLLPDEDNPDRLDVAERKLVERYRQADEAMQHTMKRVVDALVYDAKDNGTERST